MPDHFKNSRGVPRNGFRAASSASVLRAQVLPSVSRIVRKALNLLLRRYLVAKLRVRRALISAAPFKRRRRGIKSAGVQRRCDLRLLVSERFSLALNASLHCGIALDLIASAQGDSHQRDER